MMEHQFNGQEIRIRTKVKVARTKNVGLASKPLSTVA